MGEGWRVVSDTSGNTQAQEECGMKGQVAGAWFGYLALGREAEKRCFHQLCDTSGEATAWGMGRAGTRVHRLGQGEDKRFQEK